MSEAISKWPDEQILSSVGHRIWSIRTRLEELHLGDFPTSSSLLLADVLLTIVNCLYEKLLAIQKQKTQVQDATAAEDLYMELLILSGSCAQLTSYMEIISNARAEYNVWSISKSLEELGEQIAHHAKLIMHPQWGYNYSYKELLSKLRNLVSGISSDAERVIFGGFAPYLVVLTFPTLEKDSSLRNVLLAHELGHFIDDIYKISEQVTKQPIIDVNLINAIEENIKHKSAEASIYGTETRTDVMRTATRMVKKWIKEIVADIFAVNLFGPAVVFAFEEVVLGTQPLNPVDTSMEVYPPPRLRLKIMLDHLKSIGFPRGISDLPATDVRSSILQSVTVRLDMLYKLSISAAPIDPTSYQLLAEKAVENALPYLIQYISPLQNEPWHCSLRYLEEALELVEFLEYNLPPSELPQTSTCRRPPPGWRAIVNAGWFYYIAHPDEFSFFRSNTPPDLVYSGYVKTNRLISKAIEASQVLSEFSWRKGRSSYEQLP